MTALAGAHQWLSDCDCLGVYDVAYRSKPPDCHPGTSPADWSQAPFRGCRQYSSPNAVGSHWNSARLPSRTHKAPVGKDFVRLRWYFRNNSCNGGCCGARVACLSEGRRMLVGIRLLLNNVDEFVFSGRCASDLGSSLLPVGFFSFLMLDFCRPIPLGVLLWRCRSNCSRARQEDDIYRFQRYMWSNFRSKSLKSWGPVILMGQDGQIHVLIQKSEFRVLRRWSHPCVAKSGSPI